VYSDPHPVLDAQAAWLAAYEESLDGSVDAAPVVRAVGAE
jgi:hypothetical protein